MDIMCFNEMDEELHLVKASHGMYKYKHYATFQEMYEDIAEILNDGRDWRSWDCDRILEKNGLTLNNFYDDNGDMILYDGLDYDDYMQKHLSDLTDKDYAEIIEEAIKERGYGHWDHKCFVIIKEDDDDKCYEITNKDFDENGKFVGMIDDRKAIRLRPLREEFTEILENKYEIYENVDDILYAVQDMLEFMVEDTKTRTPYATNSINRYEQAAQEVSFLISDLDD